MYQNQLKFERYADFTLSVLYKIKEIKSNGSIET